ncbi:sugar porter family MFS transporter [Pontibacter saemangeumensis]|uniref:Sugar porter family MFS transporter n=1 Tax=Pontibacter saemangeumensis TaxID=1084525 RepID=A0ABP8LWV3_9BACT
MNKKVFFWSIVVALGGFLFGFDTAVISGAERDIQDNWSLNVFEHGLTVSIALFGTVIGALFGGIPSDKLGRKKTLFWIAVFYFISAVGSALATGWYAFLFFRFLGGLGVGASSVTAPLYISEIAPARSRGRLVALFQFNIVFGILIAFLSNYLIGGTGPNDWRWMLGVEAFPAVGFLLGVLFVPESPRWLILKRNRVEEARGILQAANPEVDAALTVREILETSKHDASKPAAPFFSSHYSRPITLAVLFAFFNQLSGINAIIYYAPRIFEMTGLGQSSALLSSAGVGLVNFLFTLLALNFIDRFGRRTLMLIGSFGLIVTLGLVSLAFFTQSFQGYAVPIYLFIYIAFFAFSQGAVIWVFISEIFPNEVRASGQALGSFTHWILAAIIAFAFPYVAETLGGGLTFLIFCVMMVLQLIFVWRMMPETKETSLEQIGRAVVEDEVLEKAE